MYGACDVLFGLLLLLLLLQESKQLKAMMYALISHEEMTPGPNHINSSMVITKGHAGLGDPSSTDREVAFVFTDIESSTELSQQDPEAFKQVCMVWQPSSGRS